MPETLGSDVLGKGKPTGFNKVKYKQAQQNSGVDVKVKAYCTSCKRETEWDPADSDIKANTKGIKIKGNCKRCGTEIFRMSMK